MAALPPPNYTQIPAWSNRIDSQDNNILTQVKWFGIFISVSNMKRPPEP